LVGKVTKDGDERTPSGSVTAGAPIATSSMSGTVCRSARVSSVT
jgi:hypothetical protein